MDHPAFTLGNEGIVQPINDAGSATYEIRAAESGRRWAIFYLHIEADADTSLTFKSGSTALTGAIRVAASTAGTPAPLILDGHNNPILLTSAVGDTFNVDNSASAALDGFALLMGVESK